jgi:hypothetical protein
MRHTIANLALESGAGLDVVSDLLGHASIDTTKGYYLNQTTDRLRSATNAIQQVLTEKNGSAPQETKPEPSQGMMERVLGKGQVKAA